MHELLPQCLADALRDGAVGLAVDDQWVDAAADMCTTANGVLVPGRRLCGTLGRLHC
jgi:hypothetical protein